MFNSDFYPTPRATAEYLINGIDLAGKYVLEPSAGSGAILDVLNELGAKTIACEKDRELREIAKSKTDRFLKSDFLEVTREEISHVDYVFMNPPFSKGVDHVLHAWNIAPDGCEIHALCNAETLKNRYTRLRSELGQAIIQYGFWENIGSVFEDSQRKTDVEVAVVRLYKPATEGTFEDFFDMAQPGENQHHQSGIMPYNEVREVVQRYVGALKLYETVADTAIKMNALIAPVGAKSVTMTITEEEREVTIEEFRVNLQKLCWKWVFGKMNIEKYMTANLKEELNRFVQKQQQVPFTMKNIYRMMDMVVQTHGQRMEKVLLELFDKLTLHYHDNRYAVEGWKTNSHYLVNRKFIFPWVKSSWSFSGRPEISHTFEVMDDTQKALNYLTGNRFEVTLSEFYREEKREWGKWYEWGYFMVRVYKKGTGHFKFIDDEVWALFNQAVAKAKGWPLPESKAA